MVPGLWLCPPPPLLESHCIRVNNAAPVYQRIHSTSALGIDVSKTYAKESMLSTMARGVDEKSWWTWYWPIVRAIADLEPHHSKSQCVQSDFLLNNYFSLLTYLCWDNCLVGDMGINHLVTVDGTNFHIQEYSRKFKSHKYKSSGLQYEVAL